jgi:hypothetical protein
MKKDKQSHTGSTSRAPADTDEIDVVLLEDCNFAGVPKTKGDNLVVTVAQAKVMKSFNLI